MTTSTGAVCYDADFLPYGQEVDYTSTCGSNFKFESKERDLETGNDDFGARYYRSALGRWLSPDWSAIPAPVPYADLTNPQTLNLYAMTRDNPESFADLDGHCAEDACVAEGGTALVVLGIAVTVGAEAYLNTPSGQRSMETFTSAAGQSISNSISSIKNFFSKKDSSSTSEPKDVYIDPNKHPAAAGHAADAQAGGQPDVLTVDRAGASDRRAAATAGHETQAGTDRDEYPPAVTAEGGRGASVRNIPSSDNRGAGASIGQQIKDVPNGSKIRIVPETPKPGPD